MVRRLLTLFVYNSCYFSQGQIEEWTNLSRKITTATKKTTRADKSRTE